MERRQQWNLSQSQIGSSGTFIAFLADLPVALAAKEFRKVLLQSDADDQWPTTVKYRSMIHDILRNRD
jgi:hypothetical protein